MVDLVLSSLLFIPIFSLLGWLASLLHRDASIADVFWGLGFIGLAWWAYYSGGGSTLIPVLVSIWGLRLSTFIYNRNRKKEPDFRYEKWRQENPNSWWWRSYLKVFLLQSCLLWLVGLVVVFGSYTSFQFSPEPILILGVLIALVGIVYESIADYQLSKFKSDLQNKGKVFSSGLWAYSRHPNYFGEFVFWWGIFLIAVEVTGYYWLVLSPLVISYLLLKVSGVTMLEKELVVTKPRYAEYIESTPAFFPKPR